MFAESLVESAPHLGHRSAYTKLVSTLLQCLALAVALTIPLFHLERLQVLPPVPSVRMTRVQPPPNVQQQAPPRGQSSAPAPTQLVEPRHIPPTIARIRDASRIGPAPTANLSPCIGDCSSSIPVTNILSPGPVVVTQPPRPSRPPRVSTMQLGDLIRKVIPEYPIAAKQLGIQGQVVLTALVGKDGRVEHVQYVSGPALLVEAAKRAVEQWQYRPYVLNSEPIEVQTQITVNFLLER